MGLRNYTESLTQDPYFLRAVGFTLRYVGWMVVLQNVLALLFAVLVEALGHGRVLFRTILFMPNMISMVIGGFMWLFIFTRVLPNVGGVLSFLDQSWIGDSRWSFVAILAVSLWAGVGYLMVIYVAALQGVPRQLIESASIDGASPFRVFRSVTLPMILPAVIIGVFLSLNMSFKVFEVVYALTGGGPGRATQVIALNIFEEAFISLFPVYMALISSVKTDGQIMTDILALRSVWNTVVVVVVGIGGIVLFAAMAGYKLSRTRGVLSGALFGLFVMSMLIPFHSIMITLTRVSRLLHVQGSTVGLGVIYVGLGVPMAIFLYHGFVKSVPRDLDEAAVIDGCGEFRFFLQVVLPLLMPITVTVIILNTLWMWNDFLLPLLMITDTDQYTVLLATNMLFGQYSNNDWSLILATLVLAMLPVVTLFLLLQKHVMQGIVDGAIKG